MPTLNPGASIDVVVPAGSSIAVRAYEDATVNVMIPLGQPGGPASVVSGTGRAFGPFSVATNVRLFAAEGVCQYEVNGSTAGAGASATIVDDLTTGGRTSALSAEQGVVLKGLVDANTTALAGKAAAPTAPVAVSASRPLTNADAGKTLDVTASGVTLTVPAGLNLVPGVIIQKHSSGTSVAVSGGATLNGATTTLALTASVAALVPSSATDAYKLAGA